MIKEQIKWYLNMFLVKCKFYNSDKFTSKKQ